MYNVSMERINISLTPQQLDALRKYRKETSIGISELIRRLVDEWRIQNAKDNGVVEVPNEPQP